jgi:hypothetical protein
MKRNLVLLVAFGLLFSPAFALDDDYDGFRLKDVTPSGSPLPIWNCDMEKDGPFMMHAELGLETPFEENKNVEIYVYNPNTGGWSQHHTCTNVDSGGKDCSFYFPVYWGMSETSEGGYVDLLRAELDGGEYSRTFNFYLSHRQTNQEEVILSKIEEFEGLLASLGCRQDEFSGVVAETLALGRECELDDARDVISTAINEINAVECGIPVPTLISEEPEAEEPSGGEPAAPAEETPSGGAPVMPPSGSSGVTAPPAPSGAGGLPCGIGFALLALGAAAFARG